MKMIIAVIKPSRLDAVLEAVTEIGAAIDLGLALLAAVATNLCHRQP